MADISKIKTASGDVYDIKDATARADLSLKAPIADPEFTGSISLGRDPSSLKGENTVAVGSNTKATGYETFAEGYYTEATGAYTHAEGSFTKATAMESHAMGFSTVANGERSLVFGSRNVPDTINNLPLWQSNAFYSVGDIVQRGDGYTAYCKTAHTSRGSFSLDSDKWVSSHYLYKYVEIVGNGLDGVSSHTSNARALDWRGNEYLNGDLYIKCDSNSANGIKVSDRLLTDSDRTKLNNMESVFIAYDPSDDCIEVTYI